MARGASEEVGILPKRKGLLPFGGKAAYKKGPFSLQSIFQGLDGNIPTIDEEKNINILTRKFMTGEKRGSTIQEEHYLLDPRRSDLPGNYTVISARTEIPDVDFASDGSLKHITHPSTLTLVYKDGKLVREMSDGFDFRKNGLWESALAAEKGRKLSRVEKIFPGLRHRLLLRRVKKALESNTPS